MSELIVAMGRWQARKETLGDVLRLVAELRSKSLAEPGCLGYDVFHHVDDPAALLLLERYRDSAALESHRLSGHYRELVVDRILPLLESRHVELLGFRDELH